jgi:hypothetical protein
MEKAFGNSVAIGMKQAGRMSVFALKCYRQGYRIFRLAVMLAPGNIFSFTEESPQTDVIVYHPFVTSPSNAWYSTRTIFSSELGDTSTPLRGDSNNALIGLRRWTLTYKTGQRIK